MGVGVNELADTAFDVWKYGGQSVVVALVTAALVKAQGGRGDVAAHDRRVANLNVDLRRWIADRDRVVETELALIAAYARNPDLEGPFVDRLIALRAPVPDALKGLPAGSQYDSGAHLRWRAEAKRLALHQWRDHGTLKLREYHDVMAPEGRVALNRGAHLRVAVRAGGYGAASAVRTVLARLLAWSNRRDDRYPFTIEPRRMASSSPGGAPLGVAEVARRAEFRIRRPNAIRLAFPAPHRDHARRRGAGLDGAGRRSRGHHDRQRGRAHVGVGL